MFRSLYGKLGMPCIVGPPNMAKTKEIKSAMHMASSHKYLFANKVRMDWTHINILAPGNKFIDKTNAVCRVNEINKMYP